MPKPAFNKTASERMPQLHWPKQWHSLIAPESLLFSAELAQFLHQEYAQSTVLPPLAEVFQAFELTAPHSVRVVILGQDPYHNLGQSHGLAFSVKPGVKTPPSLRNIFRELQEDVGCKAPDQGGLQGWAQQGVLLLNTVLTVRAHTAASHQKKGWEALTDQVIHTLSEHHPHLVFVLWGNAAQKKQPLIHSRHTVLKSVHPSPLSARRGFFGSRPFSQANEALKKHQQTPIQWCNTQGVPT